MAELENELKFIKDSGNGKYSLVRYKDKYYFLDNTREDDNLLYTPGKNMIGTLYLPLAERIFVDIQRYGLECMSPESILPWHYTMTDNFSKMKHSEVESILNQSFLQRPDWTFEVNQDEDYWIEMFGEEGERVEALREWLSKCTHMQMTAACCIGNAYESINFAYVLARLMENFEGNKLNQKFNKLVRFLAENTMYGPAKEIMNDFKTFELYYGIHLEEEGPIINEKFDDEDETDEYIGKNVLTEALVGRNFYLYIDGKKAKEQPLELELNDLELDIEEDDEYEDDEDGDDDNEIGEYLPEKCWVKRICAVEDGCEAYHLLVVSVDEAGKIESVSALLEEVTRGGGGWFMAPGMELEGYSSYEEMDCLPEDVITELDALINVRFLKDDFSFIGKRLPQAMIDAGGNGGSDTEYTYALQSAYRLAYMYMSIDTDEDGIVECFNYTTYQSSGSSYGDMFSRPTEYYDSKDEAIDMLLYILDQYTEEEIESIS